MYTGVQVGDSLLQSHYWAMNTRSSVSLGSQCHMILKLHVAVPVDNEHNSVACFDCITVFNGLDLY